nr:DUF3265 domain-containing protein [Vibrio parahaemolyticus]
MGVEVLCRGLGIACFTP